MKINANFIGGNILVKERKGDTFFLECDLRDTQGDWFYWAFCAEGFEGKRIKFVFNKPCIGYFGPAVSNDLKSWRWLESGSGDSFEYEFSPIEHKVYFAHHMLYHPDRFNRFALKHNLHIEELCKSLKGRSVPFFRFGDGKKNILLASRHHACESTGSYVLEGVIGQLLKEPVPDTTVFCIPFVDYDGVVDGDQGKNRAPHDHNRDYSFEREALYPEVEKIREFSDNNDVFLAFSFHSPWHLGGVNDKAFLPQMTVEKLERLEKFGITLERNISGDAFKYRHENDYPPNKDWNKVGMPCFETYLLANKGNYITSSFETAYFGESDNKVNCESLIELGKCFASAMKEYAALV